MSDGVEKFAWVSIAGAEPEPVEVFTCPETGRVGIFTVGCADAFWIDDPSAGIILFENELKKPINPETKEQRLKREEEYSKRKQRHGWRGNRK